MGKGQSEDTLWEKSSEESLGGSEERFPAPTLEVRNYGEVGISIGGESCVRLG